MSSSGDDVCADGDRNGPTIAPEFESTAATDTPNTLNDFGDSDLDELDAIISRDLQRLDSEADAILDSIRKEALDTPVTEKKTRDISLSDDESESFQQVDGPPVPFDETPHHEEMEEELEDEMKDEIKRLNNVVRSIRQEVDSQSVDSMTSALSNLDATPIRYKYSKRTVLAPQDFIRKNKLYGPGVGGQETNTSLLIATVVIWSILLLLTFHVKYGTMSSEGELNSMPDIVQKLVDRLF